MRYGDAIAFKNIREWLTSDFFSNPHFSRKLNFLPTKNREKLEHSFYHIKELRKETILMKVNCFLTNQEFKNIFSFFTQALFL